MSADYWSSTQRTKWQVTREQLIENRRRLVILEKKMIQGGLIKENPQITYDVNMRIYLHTLVVKLGRRLNLRQIALSTSEIYLSRFLSRVSIKEINVYLLVTTCLYVACKIEECPQHIRLITSEARNLWPEYIPQDVSKLAEFEFYLIEELDMYLVLHHPYSSLLQVKEFLHVNSTTFGFELTEVELQYSWSLLNDSYITDLHLIFPPHIIAIAAVYITVVLKKNLNEIRSTGNPVAEVNNNQVTSNSQDSMHIEEFMNINDNANIVTSVGSSREGNLGGQRLDEDKLKIEAFMNFLNFSHINLDEVVEAMREIISLYIAWDRYNESMVRKALQLMLLGR